MKNVTSSISTDGFSMMRHGKDIADMDRSFDLEYWQRQGDKAIFDAAFEMIEFYLRENNIHDRRLQRTVEQFQRTRS